MKWLLLLTISMITVVSSCGNKEEKTNNADSSNVLNDTLPAARPPDSLPLDSNPADGTKIDTGKGDFN